jgi:hypothetical protein
MQDFFNKRGNAHASFFVASMFGLFNLLALMGRFVDRSLFSVGNLGVIISLLLSYGFVWFFGLYSLLNFFFYATVAQIAERKIVGEMESELIDEVRKSWTLIPRRFASVKEQTKNTSAQTSENKSEQASEQTFEVKVKWLGRNKETLFVIAYVAIGLLSLVAFLIWF